MGLSVQFESLPISALNQYSYCPRRCYLIHCESEFADNLHTLSGTNEHENVNLEHTEFRANVRTEFSLPVWSEKLGLTGICDVVEFYPNGIVYPIEYKHGKRRKWANDDVQLAAQAMCLEEMLSVHIPAGAVYHIQSRRRRKIEINQELRDFVRQTVLEVREILNDIQCPKPTNQVQRCRECSMNSLCNPVLITKCSSTISNSAQLFSVSEELD